MASRGKNKSVQKNRHRNSSPIRSISSDILKKLIVDINQHLFPYTLVVTSVMAFRYYFKTYNAPDRIKLFLIYDSDDAPPISLQERASYITSILYKALVSIPTLTLKGNIIYKNNNEWLSIHPEHDLTSFYFWDTIGTEFNEEQERLPRETDSWIFNNPAQDEEKHVEAELKSFNLRTKNGTMIEIKPHVYVVSLGYLLWDSIRNVLIEYPNVSKTTINEYTWIMESMHNVALLKCNTNTIQSFLTTCKDKVVDHTTSSPPLHKSLSYKLTSSSDYEILFRFIQDINKSLSESSHDELNQCSLAIKGGIAFDFYVKGIYDTLKRTDVDLCLIYKDKRPSITLLFYYIIYPLLYKLRMMDAEFTTNQAGKMYEFELATLKRTYHFDLDTVVKDETTYYLLEHKHTLFYMDYIYDYVRRRSIKLFNMPTTYVDDHIDTIVKEYIDNSYVGIDKKQLDEYYTNKPIFDKYPLLRDFFIEEYKLNKKYEKEFMYYTDNIEYKLEKRDKQLICIYSPTDRTGDGKSIIDLSIRSKSETQSFLFSRNEYDTVMVRPYLYVVSFSFLIQDTLRMVRDTMVYDLSWAKNKGKTERYIHKFIILLKAISHPNVWMKCDSMFYKQLLESCPM
jgi:hypothetical protein